MATSLAAQLKKLTVPQSTIYKDDNRVVSLLFDPKEAALKDRDTFYEIGRSGLSELIALNEGFIVYEGTLFSLSSKDFERAMQDKEVNENLDKTIERFLLQVSPYILLQPTHKALEWLINRYHIHEYNQDSLMALILPYHSTKIFVRIVQLMNIRNDSSRWGWLRFVQKNGTPLPNQTLFNQCVQNQATMGFIANSTLKYVEQFGVKGNQLNTIFAFFCQTAIGMVNSTKKVTESMINVLLPTLISAIDSPIANFRASAYIVLGYLFTKTSFKARTLSDIVDKLLTTSFDLSYDVVLLIIILCEHQKNFISMTEILNDLSIDIIHSLCGHLKILVERQNNITPFVLVFLSSVLPQMQKDSEEFMRYSKLPEMLLDEVDFKNQNPNKILYCILNNYLPARKSTKKGKGKDGNESDIEIIEDDDHFSNKIFNWYAVLLKNFERHYPDSFDRVIKTIMSSEIKMKGYRKDQLSKLLGFKPSIAHKLGATYLFENLNHINSDLRIEGIKYIKNDIDTMMKEDPDFVRDSIISRMNDTNPQVVKATLSIPTSNLEKLLNETEVTKALVKICGKQTLAWKPVIKQAIIKLCSLKLLPVNQDVIIALLPYLFAYDEDSSEVAWEILSSEWGKKFKLTQDVIGLKESHKDNPGVVNQMVYKALFIDKIIDLNEILDENLLNKDNTTDICFFILLKSCYFDKAAVEEVSHTLNLLLESVEGRSIVMATDGKMFSSELVPELIKESRKDNILFEFIEYLFSRVIKDVNIKEISKPWCNLCKTSEMILIRRMYEICITGCSIPSYGEHYVKLLHNLLDKYFETPKEKFEFIANFACGHILYAADPKDVIGPELQLKSIKLLNNFIAIKDDTSWLHESDVLVLMILFNLNNPLEAIRQSVIDIIIQILQEKPNNKLIYIHLFEQIMTHDQALLLDHQQVTQVLKTILTQKDPQTKLFRRNCLLQLMSVLVSESTPIHIKSSILKILANFDIALAFPHIIPVLNSLENALKTHDKDARLNLDIYESNLFKSVYSLINEATITTFDKPHVWDSVEFGLKEYRECILQEDQSYTSPAVLVMKQIEEDSFKNIPKEKRTEFVRLIGLAGAVSNNPTVSSVASRLMKKIHLTFDDFKPIFQQMINAVDPSADSSKTKRNVSTSSLSYELTETDDWRLGVAVLEYVQNKKKMELDKSFVPILFELLDKCLRFEEQSYVEYTKQLILSSMWYYCKKFINVTDREVVKALKSGFKVELIVQCIRGTQNPQTHHHALILLSHAAYMLPEQVLHHTMEIFTFMGSSVLRHDDAYSFQIITRIIETLIPILVKLDTSAGKLTEKALEDLQKRAVPVLRIFADVVLHVPEHRRLPLYKKLIETIGPSHFLWVFVALLLEAHVAHFSEIKKKDDLQSRTLAEQEAPINRLDFGQNILLEFPPDIWLGNFIKLMLHIKSLPHQKDENAMETDVDPSDIFSVNAHSPNQLRHYKYIVITFMNNCLSSSRFIQHNSQATDLQVMGEKYKVLIINTLTYIQSISKVSDEKTAKYWRVILHHTYDLLDHTNNLLSAPMFLSVIRGLLKHTLQTVRRKSMELLNSKIQHHPEFLVKADRETLLSLLDPLLDIIKTIDSKNENLNETAAQELELNQQTALLSLKLVTRMLASEKPEPFKPVLDTVTEYICNPSLSGNVMASMVLCLAELCSNLKAHALTSLRKFMPALIKVLKKQRKAETPELVLLSTVTAIAKIVESLPLFLSPYVQKILYEYSILLAKWQSSKQDQVSVVVAKLANIKKKIAGAIPPRVLIPAVSETHQMLLLKGNFDAIGPVMSVLADSFASVTTADFTALQQDLTAFFLAALQLRSDATDKDIDLDVIDKAEDEVVKALVNLVLKLSETSFRPFYFKIYDWAIRTNIEGQKDRVITFYRLSSAIAEQLKGLFVLFASHFIKNAADLLDSCNNSKTEEHYFDSEDKCLTLIRYIIKTLNIVFLYDSQSFLNKDRFETLMQPVVDQLENTMGGIPSLKARSAEFIIPCVSQFAVATADDSLWKLLNYQILLKTRHNDAEIRLTALDCLVAMATQLGSSWLPLLAESVPFLAELLEDGDARIETATKDAIRKLETILGEPLEKYF